ncbi:MAG: hypothetical protein C0594_13940 [Marinilabiliales bacterium]|nr:MAG: hypothetical protein C0594_13940 [Marinilabiliales bacterium]
MIKEIIMLSVVLLISVSVMGQKVELDKRAKNHYTDEQISKIPDVKREKMNFMYRESFIIPEEMQGKLSKDDIDVTPYHVFRKQSERQRVPLNIDEEQEFAPADRIIILLSQDEVDEAFAKIDKKYANQ